MIPRLKPFYDHKELVAALTFWRRGVEDFEEAFAKKFGARYALAFPYGRSGLYAFYKAMGIEGAEIIMPAYTCVVVPNATVISGNIPRFVDCTLDDYNMDLDEVAGAISDNTRVVIATHLFGYPLDTGRLKEIIRTSGKKIYVVQDCAHSFACEWKGRPVCSEPDITLYSLNISKQMSAVFGGIITTRDPEIYRKMKEYRDTFFTNPSVLKQLKKILYLIAVYVAFNGHIYGFINRLERSGFLNRFVRYYDESIIDVPPDFMTKFGDLEGRVGLVQLEKYDEIRRRRIEIAEQYDDQLNGIPDLVLPPIIDGATYSHYVIRTPTRERRDQLMQNLLDHGIQLGYLIEYSIPEMPAYTQFRTKECPNSLYCSERMINLPNYPGLTEIQIHQICKEYSR